MILNTLNPNTQEVETRGLIASSLKSSWCELQGQFDL